MNEWFRSSLGWTAFGFLGQFLFGSRFVVQWLASEREGRVVIPTLFWTFSLLGGLALLTYAIHRRDPVFAIGQAAGLVIYVRNLTLHRRGSRA
jgi:lipid-A-disaccharide synthase-like uncharacterized protein